MLTLVFVESLNLNVEYAVRIDFEVEVAVVLAVLKEVFLVFTLYLCKLVENGLVILEERELAELAAVL